MRYYIGMIPGRKRCSLCRIDGDNTFIPVAYFKDDKEAQLFIESVQKPITFEIPRDMEAQ